MHMFFNLQHKNLSRVSSKYGNDNTKLEMTVIQQMMTQFEIAPLFEHFTCLSILGMWICKDIMNIDIFSTGLQNVILCLINAHVFQPPTQEFIQSFLNMWKLQAIADE